MRDFFFSNSLFQIIIRYISISILKTLWFYANNFDIYRSINAFIPPTSGLINIPNALFYQWQINALPISVFLIFSILQWGLILGALRAVVRYARLLIQPEPAADHPLTAALTIDGRRIRRSGWMTPVLMTIAIVVSCYLLAWAGWMIGVQRPIPLLLAIYTLGYWPLSIGLVLSFMGTMAGRRFSSAARASVGGLAGVQYLPEGHQFAQRVHDMASRLDLPKPAVGITNVVNAFAVGQSHSSAAVVIGTPLAQALNHEELNAVIGHELGHIVSNDMTSMQFAAGYQAMFGAVVNASTRVGAQASRNQSAGLLVLAIGRLLHVSVMLVSDLFVKRLSRSREFYADAVGAVLSSPEAMISALQKVHGVEAAPAPVENRYGYLMFRPRRTTLFSTHPSLKSRIQALQRRTYIERVVAHPLVGMSQDVAPAASLNTTFLDAFEASLGRDDSAPLPSLHLTAADRLSRSPPDQSRFDLLWRAATTPAVKRIGFGAAVLVLLVIVWLTVPVDSVTAALRTAVNTFTGANVREAEARVAERERSIALREADLKQNEAFLDTRRVNVAKREEDARGREIVLTTRESAVNAKEALLNSREQELLRREANIAQPGSGSNLPQPGQPRPDAPPNIPAQVQTPPLQTGSPPMGTPYPPMGSAPQVPLDGVVVGMVLQAQNGDYYYGKGSSPNEAINQAVDACSSRSRSCREVAVLTPGRNQCFVVSYNRMGQKSYGIGPTLAAAGEESIAKCQLMNLFAKCQVDRRQNFCIR